MALLTRRYRGGLEGRLNFWPAYVDLMVVLAFTSLFAFSVSEGDQSTEEKYKEAFERCTKDVEKIEEYKKYSEKIMHTLEQKLKKDNITVKSSCDSIILGDSVLSFGTREVAPIMSESQRDMFFGICRAIKASIDEVENGRQSFEIVIEGHTDSVPIHTGCFPSNWELSAARATNILRLMADQANCDMTYDRYSLKAIGYGETKPIEMITGPSERNRRIEIKIVPNYEKIEKMIHNSDIK